MCRFEDYPPILIKKKVSRTVRKSNILGLIEGYSHCKHEVIAAYKPRFSFFPKKWRDYHFFETEYRKVPADDKQLKSLNRLNAEYDSNITYVVAKDLISKIEKELSPTPSVCKALKSYGEDPANYTREKADRFLEEKEQEEENKAKLNWKDNLIQKFLRAQTHSEINARACPVLGYLQGIQRGNGRCGTQDRNDHATRPCTRTSSQPS